MFFAGLDLGSTTTKAVIIDKDNNIAGYHILLSGNDYRKISRLVLEKATDKAKVNLKSISHIITTGYGRHIAESSTKAVTEISCTNSAQKARMPQKACGAPFVVGGVHNGCEGVRDD